MKADYFPHCLLRLSLLSRADWLKAGQESSFSLFIYLFSFKEGHTRNACSAFDRLDTFVCSVCSRFEWLSDPAGTHPNG